jgi:3-(3-hydroxy-phenyl)propionate hydroxylase
MPSSERLHVAPADPVERARELDGVRRQSNDSKLHDAFIRRACLIDNLREANATA